MEKELSKITVFCKEDEEVNVGDEVVLTTSELEFNNLTGCFDNNVTKAYTVLAEHIGEDYSDFKPELCRTGGCYGYDYFKVVKINEEVVE